MVNLDSKVNFSMLPSIAGLRAPVAGMLVALIGGSVVLAQSAPSHAATITFNLFSNSPEALVPPPGSTAPIFGDGDPSTTFIGDYIGPSLSFEKAGVKLTVSNPQGASGPAVSRSTTTLGTCLGGARPSSTVVCGNEGGDLSPQVSSITLKFDKPVKLISTSGVLRSFTAEIGTAAPEVTSVWNFQALSQSFTYTNTIPTPPPFLSFTNPYASTFNDNFIVSANSAITVSSTFAGSLDYWAQTLEVELVPDSAPVPGPLPLFGAASAFSFSRRIRKRIKQS
jgi:hypothetical protein